MSPAPNNFQSKSPHYEFLRKKWTQKHQDTKDNLFDQHLRNVAIGSLSGLMLLTTPALYLPSGHLLPQPHDIGNYTLIDRSTSQNALLAGDLGKILPSEVRPLTPDEEKQIAQVITKRLEIPVAAELDGKRLNRSYGLIGAEQHLYRYPGDQLEFHARDATDWAMYGKSGIAPGLGAWGYFAPSKAEFSKQDEENERYYLAVQTWLSSGYAERVREYRDFYKFRKMLVVNTKTGQSCVAVIGDAGPAEWTGKHLGGSPEVMHEIGLATGPRKGPVLYFFVDDPENKIPLGPVEKGVPS